MTAPYTKYLGDYWLSLHPRERIALTGGSILLSALLVFFLLWLPMQEQLAQARQGVAERSATLQWMQQATIEVARLRPLLQTSHKKEPNQDKSLLSLADQTARNHGLGDALKRVEPDGTTRVQLSFEKVSFDALIEWLSLLDQQYDIHIKQLNIETGGTPGQVQARLVLGERDKP